MFKNKTRLGNDFHFKDPIPKDLTSGVVYKFQCGLCNVNPRDTWMLELANILVYRHLPKNKLNLKTAP